MCSIFNGRNFIWKLFAYHVHFIELQFVSESCKGGTVQAKEVEILVQLVIFLPNKASFKGPFTRIHIECHSKILLSFLSLVDVHSKLYFLITYQEVTSLSYRFRLV